MKSFVYKWTNTITGEYYIGVHKGLPDDGYIGSGKKFKSKYNKYPELFEREIISECDHYEDALCIEKKMITKDIILNDTLCLNLKPGGEGGGCPGWAKRVCFKKRSEKRKENAKNKGVSYGQHRIGAKWSDEIKLKQSVAAKNRKKVKCSVCSKIGPLPQMSRWHFKNCKEHVNG